MIHKPVPTKNLRRNALTCLAALALIAVATIPGVAANHESQLCGGDVDHDCYSNYRCKYQYGDHCTGWTWTYCLVYVSGICLGFEIER